MTSIPFRVLLPAIHKALKHRNQFAPDRTLAYVRDRARMMVKLDIRDFAGLIKFAIQHGITSLE